MDEQLRHYADKLAYEIDSWDLKLALESGEKVIVIDARSPQAFAAGHIPGAISLPHRTMSEATTAALDRIWWKRDGHPVEGGAAVESGGPACGCA